MVALEGYDMRFGIWGLEWMVIGVRVVEFVRPVRRWSVPLDR
jgi:hypothetical protein